MQEEKKYPKAACKALRSPGPANYKLPPLTGYDNHDVSKYRNPAYSMRPIAKYNPRSMMPGPKYVIEKNFTRYGPNGIPEYSLGMKLRPFRTQVVPGPGAYSPELVPEMKHDRPPAYSLSGRNPILKEMMSPGPAKYKPPTCLGPDVPDKIARPAYSMSRRTRPYRGQQMPSPAEYKPVDIGLYKDAEPAFTIAPRNDPPISKMMNPGPGKYMVTYNRHKEPPAYTFGLRQSDCMRIPTIPEDNAL